MSAAISAVLIQTKIGKESEELPV